MRYTHECSLTYFYPPFNKEFALLTAVCYGNFLWGCFSITHFSVANLVYPVPEDVCGDTAFAEVCRPARGGEHLPCGAPAIRTDARVSFVLLYDLARSESLL